MKYISSIEQQKCVGNQANTVRKDRQTDKPGRTEGQTVEPGHRIFAQEESLTVVREVLSSVATRDREQ